jgi:hypothetical protein
LEASPKFTIEVVGGLDHSMFDLDARGRVHDVVQNWSGVVSQLHANEVEVPDRTGEIAGLEDGAVVAGPGLHLAEPGRVGVASVLWRSRTSVTRRRRIP